MDSQGSNGIAYEEDAPREISSARRVTKMEAKRAAAREERRRRHINNGVPEDKVDSVMAQEDYDNLPVAEKFERFQMFASRAFQSLQQDILALRHNDGVIADAMDINLKAIARGLTKAGISVDQQSAIIAEVEKEMKAEREAEKEIQVKAQKEKEEKALMQQEAAAVPSLAAVPEEGEENVLPEDATIFGDS